MHTHFTNEIRLYTQNIGAKILFSQKSYEQYILQNSRATLLILSYISFLFKFGYMYQICVFTFCDDTHREHEYLNVGYSSTHYAFHVQKAW